MADCKIVFSVPWLSWKSPICVFFFYQKLRPPTGVMNGKKTEHLEDVSERTATQRGYAHQRASKFAVLKVSEPGGDGT